jgi:hypothetical protein
LQQPAGRRGHPNDETIHRKIGCFQTSLPPLISALAFCLHSSQFCRVNPLMYLSPQQFDIIFKTYSFPPLALLPSSFAAAFPSCSLRRQLRHRFWRRRYCLSHRHDPAISLLLHVIPPTLCLSLPSSQIMHPSQVQTLSNCPHMRCHMGHNRLHHLCGFRTHHPCRPTAT